AVDLRHRPAQPLEQVDGVHALVRERAAAVHRPGALPHARAVEVRLRPVPVHGAVHADELAQTAGGERLLQATVKRLEAGLEDNLELAAGLSLAGNHGIDPGNRDIRRLLADDVLPGAECLT